MSISPDCYSSPLTTRPLTSEGAEQLARAFKAMADPVRLRLLSLIASHENGEACVCDLTETFDLSGPTISHHLKVLREAGLIEGERRGTWIYYRARPTMLRQLALTLTPDDEPADVATAV
ncbi:ArsR/SmtB family transcription factor [Saccharopolyspora sp. 5N102]|uniref:ArsR/SmtB family transcription factor n=1 Tax=Saccharopolyspora sp. 5N102 TaxID=3375155 RepID=UPI0037BC55B9